MKKIINYVILFLGLIFVYILLLGISFLVPKKDINDNIISTALTIIEEQNNRDYTIKTRQDYYTESIIYNVVLSNNDEKNFLKKIASNANFYIENNNDRAKELYLTSAFDNKTNTEYYRYWFGSTSFIRFLSIFFTIKGIRIINIILLLSLFIGCLYFINKKLNIWYSIIFALSIIFMSFFTVIRSLQYSPVMYIMLISCIMTFAVYYKNKKLIPYMFFIIGSLTSYFDLLTFPLITLCYPLIIYFLLEYKEERISKRDYIDLIIFVVLWGTAYALTFLAKWSYASIVLHKDCFKDSIDQFLFRISDESVYGKLNKFYVISLNFKVYFDSFVILSMIFLPIVVYAFNRKNKTRKFNKYLCIIMVLIIVSPYMWYFLVANHSFYHTWMSFRIQGITYFGLLSYIISFINFKKDTKLKK